MTNTVCVKSVGLHALIVLRWSKSYLLLLQKCRLEHSAAYENYVFATEPRKTFYLISNGLSTAIKLAIYCLKMVITAGHPCSTLQPQLTPVKQPIPKTTIGEIKAALCKPQKPLFLLSTKPMATASRARDCSRISSRKGWVFSKLILVLWSWWDEHDYVAGRTMGLSWKELKWTAAEMTTCITTDLKLIIFKFRTICETLYTINQAFFLVIWSVKWSMAE